MINNKLTILFAWIFAVLSSSDASAQCFAAVGAGHNHSFGITANGKLFGWGEGALGTSSWSSTPMQVGSGTDWVAINSGYYTTHAIKTDGTLWGWGQNDRGQIGDGTTNSRTFPVQVTSATDWSMVSPGTHDICYAIKDDGTLWGWGDNYDGQMGNGTSGFTTVNVPTQIGTATNWVTVSAGAAHCMAVKSDGTLWGWGKNNNGQLGDGTSTQRLVPTQIGTQNDWWQVSAGENYTIALKTDGSIWAWGLNNFGMLGDGTYTTKANPTLVSSGSWLKIKAQHSHTLAINADGSLWTWGLNHFGQLGLGNTAGTSTPTQVGGDFDWMEITSGYYHSIALKNDGSLYAWGENTHTQIGNGMTIDVYSPLLIACPTLGTTSHENGQSYVTVYPNPFTNRLNIMANDGQLHKLEIFDLHGRLIKTYIGQSNQLDLTELSSNIYLLKAYTSGGIETVRVVKL